MREWMTINDLSEYLQIPDTKIRHLVKQRQIPFHDRLGTPRFFKKEIDEWMISDVSETRESHEENENFIYRGKPIKKYMLTASKILIGPTAWNRLPDFVKKFVELFNKVDRTYLQRDEFEPLINNSNDYLRVSCQLGLIENIREGRTACYTPTEYAQRIYNEVNIGAIRQIIVECIFDIVKRDQEEIPQERHAIFLLWYLLKLKRKGVEPKEFHFNKGGETNYYPVIRLNFAKGLCDFLLGGDEDKERKLSKNWDQYI